MLPYLSDTIARVIISGLSATLLVTSTLATARSAAAVPLLFGAGSVLGRNRQSWGGIRERAG